MQLPSNLPDPFVKAISEKSEKVRQLFLKHIEDRTRKVPVKVMLGDGTVSEQESFDPALVRQLYDSILRSLVDWESSGISSTADQDLRRTFIKFEAKEEGYVLSCHMSIQYHALLFYKLNHRVIDAQKELSEVSEQIKQTADEAAPESNKTIEEKMKRLGYANFDHQKLFEIFFNNDQLTQELSEILKSSQKKLQDLTERQTALFKELDDMLIEVYHTTPVMIDEMRMIAAEEGCFCVFHLERIKKNAREGNVDIARISAKAREKILGRMDEIIDILSTRNN